MVSYPHDQFRDVIIIHHDAYKDVRGIFCECWNDELSSHLEYDFVRLNHSISRKDVLRGLHYQHTHPVGKLFRLISGRASLLIADLRSASKTYGQLGRIDLSGPWASVFVPPWFASGLLSYEDDTNIIYLCTDSYIKEFEGVIDALDRTFVNSCLLTYEPEQLVRSEKDKNGMSFQEYSRNPQF